MRLHKISKHRIIRGKAMKIKEKLKGLKVNNIIIMISLFAGIVITYLTSGGRNEVDIQKDIAQKIVRFHVIANSDSKEDQELKLKVKNEIVKYITPLLSGSKSVNESIEILNRENNNIIEVAKKVLKNEGSEYTVSAGIDNSYFPMKEYGDVVLPPGEYTAYRVEIGESKGKNWWCILYPPLCFVDVTHGVVPDKSKEMLENILDEDEFTLVTNAKHTGVKFKIVEVFKGFFK